MGRKFEKINLNNYKSLSEVIFNTLREAIIVGELKPGERLMEVQLSEKMGVSRTPIREAIRKLELEGLVKTLPRKGVYVAELSPEDIEDVLEVRAALDGLAAFLAADRIAAEEIKNLKSVLKQFEQNVEKNSTSGIVKKDVEFHDIIYRASGNSRLIQILNNLKEQILRFRVIYIKDYSTHEGLVKEHAQIVRAIEERDRLKAQVLAENHIKYQRDVMMKAVKNM